MSRALFIATIVAILVVVGIMPASVDAQDNTGCYVAADLVTIEEVHQTLWIHLHTEEYGTHHLKVEGAWSGVLQDFDYSYNGESYYYLVAFSVVPDIYLVTNRTPSGSGCMTIVVVGDPSSITPPEESQVQLPGGPSNYCYDVEYGLQGDQLVITGHIAGEGLDRGIVDWGEDSTALSFPNGDYFEASGPFVDTVSVVLSSGAVCSQAHIVGGNVIKDW